MAKGEKGKGDETGDQPGSPREPDGPTAPAKSGNSELLAIYQASCGIPCSSPSTQ